jgi:hypothetical protein
MNNTSSLQRITSAEDLQTERTRLTTLIAAQKYLIRKDIEDIREEIAAKFHPVAETAGFVKKLTNPETRATGLLQIGSAVLIETLVRRVFAKSNLLVQLVVPNIVRNYSTHLLFKLVKTIAQNRSHAAHRYQHNT